MRRFWQPVALSDELEDLPLRIMVLCEELVVFRDRQGRVGVLELHCSHRGTSLEFGLVAERGIRCCYHGWLYDVDGRILETPGEPDDSTLKGRLFHGAYPTREHKGLVFAYMGPPDKQPAFPLYDTYELPGYRHSKPFRGPMPCNWLQIKDNSMDPVHTSFLHTIVAGAQFTEEFAKVPELDWMETPVGMVYIATRRVGDNVWVRMNDFIPPNIHQFPPTWEDGTLEIAFSRAMGTQWSVPIDDTNTMNFGATRISEDAVELLQRRRSEANFGQTGDRPYEERQRIPGDYDAQVSQRPIAIHALERLGSTDRGIIVLRNIVRKGIRAVAEGGNPMGTSKELRDVIPTYCSDTVLRVPAAPTVEQDKQLIRETGRKVAEGYVKDYQGPSQR